MKQYEITIEARHVGIYQADNPKEAEKIAEQISNDAYNRLNGKYNVEVICVEEVQE